MNCLRFCLIVLAATPSWAQDPPKPEDPKSSTMADALARQRASVAAMEASLAAQRAAIAAQGSQTQSNSFFLLPPPAPGSVTPMAAPMPFAAPVTRFFGGIRGKRTRAAVANSFSADRH